MTISFIKCSLKHLCLNLFLRSAHAPLLSQSWTGIQDRLGELTVRVGRKPKESGRRSKFRYLICGYSFRQTTRRGSATRLPAWRTLSDEERNYWNDKAGQYSDRVNRILEQRGLKWSDLSFIEKGRIKVLVDEEGSTATSIWLKELSFFLSVFRGF